MPRGAGSLARLRVPRARVALDDGRRGLRQLVLHLDNCPSERPLVPFCAEPCLARANLEPQTQPLASIRGAQAPRISHATVRHRCRLKRASAARSVTCFHKAQRASSPRRSYGRLRQQSHAARSVALAAAPAAGDGGVLPGVLVLSQAKRGDARLANLLFGGEPALARTLARCRVCAL